MPTPHHSFFTGRMPFLPPNQQRQSTEGTKKTDNRQKTDKKKQTENKNFEKTDSTVSKTFLPHA